MASLSESEASGLADLTAWLFDHGRCPAADLEDSAVGGGGGGEEDDGGVNQRPWGFWGAAFYALTVATTLGSGPGGPRTTAGLAATVAFSLLALPLLAVAFGFAARGATRTTDAVAGKHWGGRRTRSQTRVQLRVLF